MTKKIIIIFFTFSFLILGLIIFIIQIGQKKEEMNLEEYTLSRGCENLFSDNEEIKCFIENSVSGEKVKEINICKDRDNRIDCIYPNYEVGVVVEKGKELSNGTYLYNLYFDAGKGYASYYKFDKQSNKISFLGEYYWSTLGIRKISSECESYEPTEKGYYTKECFPTLSENEAPKQETIMLEDLEFHQKFAEFVGEKPF